MAPARRLDDPPLTGAENMARDEALLATRREPTLRFYRWSQPTVSLGYFQAAHELPLKELRARGYQIVRRDTGGKAILHDRELTYSLCAPETGPLAGGPAAAMRAVHTALASELSKQVAAPVQLRERQTMQSDRVGSAWCFEDSSPLDLALNARKLVGSAARRRNGWVLFHGSLVLTAPTETPEIGALECEPDLDTLSAALGRALGYTFCLGDWHDEERGAIQTVGKRHARTEFVDRC
ncbi:MAG: hypothetical protein MK209_08310 [Planctomycetes bacterium]|nr:hypothetical protein [Planctomycetota bacterium]